MDNGYEEFQQIMAEIERKKRLEEVKRNGGNPFDLPPGFEQLFNNLRK